MADLAFDFVIFARQLAAINDFERAFDMYICAFENEPRIKRRFENEFRAVLTEMNENLSAEQNKVNIFKNYERAISLFPGNVNLLNDIGRFLYRYGYFQEALCHFEKALNIDGSYVNIEKNLNNAKSFLFPRSYFRALNDKIRNNAYRAAIKSCVKPATDSVLNIRTGPGLLALYANECRPLAITACETSHAMARLAECIIQDNRADQVIIVNKPSQMLKQTDIYGVRSILLTDMIDAGLFGEHILQSLTYAWEYLLREHSKVIPGKAEFFVVGVKSRDLNRKYKLCPELKNILNVPGMHVHTTTYYAETYYGDDVNLFEDVKYICEPKSLFTIDFNSKQDVSEKLYSQKSYTAELTPTEDGEMDMVIGWFNLHLTDEIMLTTDPRAENRASAWQQAVFFDVTPRTVRHNENIIVRFVTYGGIVTALPDVGVPITRISPETLAYLNDYEYMNLIKKSTATVCVHLGQSVDVEHVDIVDLSPFPLLGVLMMKRGANSLICHAKTREDKAFLNTVLTANQIPLDKVSILMSDCWSLEVFRGKSFHLIFCNVLNFNGDIDTHMKQVLRYLRHGHLFPGGLCLPAAVTLMGQLIYSDYLEVNNRVLDKNVDYRMANHVNRYQMSQCPYLDIGTLPYEPLSDVFEVAACESLKSNVIEVPIVRDGVCNAILCWYKVQLIDDCHEISTQRRNAFVDSMAHMTRANTQIYKGDEVNVLLCVDHDGSYKLTLET